jgi:CYTH domain-containing protein
MGKVSRSVAALARILGEPEPLEAERKFLIKGFSVATLPAHAVACDIVQTYLVSAPGQVERVRARGQDNCWVYTHTIKQFIAPGVAREQEKIITRAEYESYLVRRDYAKEVIQKTRFCFVYGGHYCELDVFRTGRRKGDVLLEIEVAQSQMDAAIMLPPFLDVLQEVTHDRDFSNLVMATPVAA